MNTRESQPAGRQSGGRFQNPAMKPRNSQDREFYVPPQRRGSNDGGKGGGIIISRPSSAGARIEPHSVPRHEIPPSLQSGPQHLAGETPNRKSPGDKLTDYDFLGAMGHGAYGSVYKVRSKLDGCLYVAKRIHVKHLSATAQRDAMTEVAILKSLNHPHIIRYYASFMDNATLYIIMEIAEGGDLHVFLARKRTRRQMVSEDLAWRYFSELVSALVHLHNRRIIHRDLKSLNIFLTADGHIKVGDLGLSKLLHHDVAMLETQVGTPMYLAPELIKQKPYDYKADIWSLGVVMYNVCALKPPFEGDNIMALAYAITHHAVPPLPQSYTSKLTALVTLCLRKKSSERPSAVDILKQLPSPYLDRLHQHGAHAAVAGHTPTSVRGNGSEADPTQPQPPNSRPSSVAVNSSSSNSNSSNTNSYSNHHPNNVNNMNNNMNNMGSKPMKLHTQITVQQYRPTPPQLRGGNMARPLPHQALFANLPPRPQAQRVTGRSLPAEQPDKPTHDSDSDRDRERDRTTKTKKVGEKEKDDYDSRDRQDDGERQDERRTMPVTHRPLSAPLRRQVWQPAAPFPRAQFAAAPVVDPPQRGQPLKVEPPSPPSAPVEEAPRTLVTTPPSSPPHPLGQPLPGQTAPPRRSRPLSAGVVRSGATSARVHRPQSAVRTNSGALLSERSAQKAPPSIYDLRQFMTTPPISHSLD